MPEPKLGCVPRSIATTSSPTIGKPIVVRSAFSLHNLFFYWLPISFSKIHIVEFVRMKNQIKAPSTSVNCRVSFQYMNCRLFHIYNKSFWIIWCRSRYLPYKCFHYFFFVCNIKVYSIVFFYLKSETLAENGQRSRLSFRRNKTTLAPMANKNLLYKRQKLTTAFETKPRPFFFTYAIFWVVCVANDKLTYLETTD